MTVILLTWKLNHKSINLLKKSTARIQSQLGLTAETLSWNKFLLI